MKAPREPCPRPDCTECSVGPAWHVLGLRVPAVERRAGLDTGTLAGGTAAGHKGRLGSRPAPPQLWACGHLLGPFALRVCVCKTDQCADLASAWEPHASARGGALRPLAGAGRQGGRHSGPGPPAAGRAVLGAGPRMVWPAGPGRAEAGLGACICLSMGQGAQSPPTSKPGKLKIPRGLFSSRSAALPTPCPAGSAGRGVRAVPGVAKWLQVCGRGGGVGSGRQARGWFRAERKWRGAHSGNGASETTSNALRCPEGRPGPARSLGCVTDLRL